MPSRIRRTIRLTVSLLIGAGQVAAGDQRVATGQDPFRPLNQPKAGKCKVGRIWLDVGVRLRLIFMNNSRSNARGSRQASRRKCPCTHMDEASRRESSIRCGSEGDGLFRIGGVEGG
jgi:hypothetical protein